MKGIILAGGTGSRLRPTTLTINKHLLHVYDRPMIFFPIQTLIDLGIREITIVTNKECENIICTMVKRYFKNYHFDFVTQNNSNGVVDAFLKGIEKHHNKEDIIMILGDNIFLGDFKNFNFKKNQSSIFTTHSNNPSRFGVINYQKRDSKFSIIEKPTLPPSNEVVTGLYFIKNGHLKYLKDVTFSNRNELEISDFNNILLEKKLLAKVNLGTKFEWFDAGTNEDLFLASKKVRDLKCK